MSHENGAQAAPETCRKAGLGLLEATSRALSALQSEWKDEEVATWIDMVLARRGRVVLCGMGKSGLIAQKISATLASTGCPSFFLHPAEALHGDLGMVTPEDSVLALSNSGESEEVVRLLPSLQRLGVPLAAITGRSSSTFGRAARWVFGYGLPGGEGCPLELAPMASTTLQLIWGDLLAAALMARRGFTRDHFALNHPAGALGSKFLKVSDLMHESIPAVAPDASLMSVLKAMSDGRLGMALVQDAEEVRGVISDGDIRRTLERVEGGSVSPMNLRALEMMNPHPKTTTPETLAIEAVAEMEARKITFLLVMERGRPKGVLHLHDYLGIGVDHLRKDLGSKSL